MGKINICKCNILFNWVEWKIKSSFRTMVHDPHKSDPKSSDLPAIYLIYVGNEN